MTNVPQYEQNREDTFTFQMSNKLRINIPGSGTKNIVTFDHHGQF